MRHQINSKNMNSVSEEIKFQALHEHYKDTFNIIREEKERRNKLMRLIFIVILFCILYALWPSEFVESLSQLFSQKLSTDFSPLNNVISTILWFVLLSVMVKYMQTVVYIERQYEYIHRIEEKIHKCYDKDSYVFTREGEDYSKKYPMFSKLIDLSYKVILPIVLIITIFLIMVGEWISHIPIELSCFLLYINTAIAIFILILIIFYIIFLHRA